MSDFFSHFTATSRPRKVSATLNIFKLFVLAYTVYKWSITECTTPLGMESGTIPDASITASTYMVTSSGWNRLPQYARLGGNRFWASAWNTQEPWIQVDLGSSYLVTGLLTEGKYGSEPYQYWVQNIKVKVGFSEDGLKFIEDNVGEPKVQTLK